MRIHSSASGLVCKLRFREQGVLRLREAHEVWCPRPCQNREGETGCGSGCT
jgi:hypothetical protein